MCIYSLKVQGMFNQIQNNWQNGSEAAIEQLERQRNAEQREGDKLVEEPEAQQADNQAWAAQKNKEMAKVLELLEKKGVGRQSFGVSALED